MTCNHTLTQFQYTARISLPTLTCYSLNHSASSKFHHFSQTWTLDDGQKNTSVKTMINVEIKAMSWHCSRCTFITSLYLQKSCIWIWYACEGALHLRTFTHQIIIQTCLIKSKRQNWKIMYTLTWNLYLCNTKYMYHRFEICLICLIFRSSCQRQKQIIDGHGLSKRKKYGCWFW